MGHSEQVRDRIGISAMPHFTVFVCGKTPERFSHTVRDRSGIGQGFVIRMCGAGLARQLGYQTGRQ